MINLLVYIIYFRIVVNDILLLDVIREDLKETLEILIDADCFAFFQSTISTFILFKSEKKTVESGFGNVLLII